MAVDRDPQSPESLSLYSNAGLGTRDSVWTHYRGSQLGLGLLLASSG